MKILVVDISGRVPNYDIALCEAIHEQQAKEDSIVLFSPYAYKNSAYKVRTFHLLDLIPNRWKPSKFLLKKGINAVQCVINYFIVFLYIIKHKVDIVHFQWLPFLEVCDLEYYLLKLFHRCFPNTRYILTAHNTFPHDSSEESKARYRKRFCKIVPEIDTFIVHTHSSKQALNTEFNVQPDKIQVAHHGIFVPQGYTPTKKTIAENNTWRLIMYGKQLHYKGTDIFVKALSLIDRIYAVEGGGYKQLSAVL